MTPQSRVRTRRAAVGLMALGAAAIFSLAGCDPRTLWYFFGDGAPQIPGEAPSFVGKKVVIVSVATPTAATEYSSIDRDLSREIRTIFSDIHKIEAEEIGFVYTDDLGAPVELLENFLGSVHRLGF